ncbi:MAG: hypothetical protein ACI9D5_002351 [Candidatus Endobugula sp.]|jgi:hypothetical protein
MHRLLTLLFLYCLSANALSINLQASVDRHIININETLLLTITLDKQGANEIDLSAVELQFDILQRQRSSQTSIVNGSISSQTKWSIILSPKETGKLIIPSFSSLGAFSDAIKIQVNNSSTSGASSGTTDQQQQNSEVFLKSTIDKNKIYVQEQLLLTLQLYYRIALSGYTPQEFSIDNSTIELTGENTFKKTVAGTAYNVLERTYAIHPQASGSIKIPALSWQVEKPNNRFGFGNTASPYLRVRSQAHTIAVMPIPNASSATQWLPASALSLSQEWQQSTITAKVGEPLTYSLSLSATGLHHAQLPTISIDSNNDFTVYTDQAKTDNQLSNKGIRGTRISHYAVIPKTAGRFTLPPVTLTWWNINTDREETITLDAQQVIVANSKIGVGDKLIVASDKSQEVISGNTLAATSVSHWLWKVSTIIFAIGALVFFILWRFNLRNNTVEKEHKTNTTSTKNTPSLKTLYRNIEQAIEKKAWLQLKHLLAEWASLVAQTSIHSNEGIIQHFPELEPALVTLDKQLYSENTVVVWDFAPLLALLKKQSAGKTSKASNDEKLTSLYQ